ncbi:hypothetical protein [Ancylobacter sp. SL191]|nr:hypothetical protein [Ancylobacter sp. SL191]WAC27684.1 hypothetical protein OU996_00950 [Ancylobacter sp. SL191]
MVNGLKNRLMAPDKAVEAMRAFAEETNRLTGSVGLSAHLTGTN